MGNENSNDYKINILLKIENKLKYFFFDEYNLLKEPIF